MSDPYPANHAERQRIRDRRIKAYVERAGVVALYLATSLKCSGGPGSVGVHHADTPDGCRNDGVTCLCECHDR